ncbi:GNAT family N-acetyltransferase [Flectobacillus major]|uniref:GNAT family N-acetyltransferase n=1 Tax=Flectobacillus major TaxID=103 RepID=UPI00040FF8E8|nr:GNAT family N-acetyltransferase [Flectobacillus major]
MKIIQATFEHLDIITPVLIAYRTHFGQEANELATHQFLQERLRQNDSVILLAIDEASNRVAGFTQLYPLFSTLKLQRVWLLNDLFVSADFRKGGVASLLVEAAYQYTLQSGACWLTLKTDVENVKAQALYDKLGFQKDNDHFYYYLHSQR